jgi:hypothetical protein
MATTNPSPEQSDSGRPGLRDSQAGTHAGTIISQAAPAGPAGQQPAPLSESGYGITTQLEEILPDIKNLALKVGGMKNLAAIIANLQ